MKAQKLPGMIHLILRGFCFLDRAGQVNGLTKRVADKGI